MFTSELVKTQHLRIIWKIEALFLLFYRSIFDAPFCYLVEQPIPAFSEIMFQNFNMTLWADLIWTCGQHVLFHNIFGYFCMSTNHNNLNFLLNN